MVCWLTNIFIGVETTDQFMKLERFGSKSEDLVIGLDLDSCNGCVDLTLELEGFADSRMCAHNRAGMKGVG